MPLEPSPAPPARDRGRPRGRARVPRGPPPDAGRRAAHPVAATDSSERQAGPVAPERFGVLQSLLAYLLAACGEERDAVIPAARADRAVLDPARSARGAPLAAQPRELRRRLLRGLRRVARRRGARRQGALRRHLPPRAAPDAARGARDPARARVRRADDRRRRRTRPLDRVRAKLEETFGAVRPRPDPRRRRPAPRRIWSRRSPVRSTRSALVELEYLKPESTEVDDAHRRAVLDRAPPAALVRAHLGRRPRRARSYRLDRMRTAKELTTGFTPREGSIPRS